jgi:hypothetical protein
MLLRFSAEAGVGRQDILSCGQRAYPIRAPVGPDPPRPAMLGAPERGERQNLKPTPERQIPKALGLEFRFWVWVSPLESHRAPQGSEDKARQGRARGEAE